MGKNPDINTDFEKTALFKDEKDPQLNEKEQDFLQKIR